MNIIIDKTKEKDGKRKSTSQNQPPDQQHTGTRASPTARNPITPAP